ncbi:dynein light chain Tctex-type protein 2B-like [Watersipora subatra]|uniref:dynein light chain Tctex-type protein 2B-like n=1 Tax=Watersipora subatra TaxID=2589382 RepID=UPI00355C870B
MESPGGTTAAKASQLGTVIEEERSANTGDKESAIESMRRKSVQLGKEPAKRKDSGPRSGSELPLRSKWGVNRRMSIMSNMSSNSRRFDPTPEPHKTLPPTYRLMPKEEEEFHWWKARPLIEDILSVYSSDLTYNPKTCSRQCLVLADMVKNKMKILGCNRHKIIVTVDIGQNQEHAMALASRCVWNTKTDNSLHIQQSNKDVYIVVSVFAIFKE